MEKGIVEGGNEDQEEGQGKRHGNEEVGEGNWRVTKGSLKGLVEDIKSQVADS